MAITSEVGLTAARELRKNMRSAKGAAMAVMFLLGGVGSSLIYLKLSSYALDAIKEQVGEGVTSEQMATMLREAKLQGLKKLYSEETAAYLVECPSVLLSLFRGTLLAIPLLTLLAGFDLVAGETQHRTMRYFVNRASRPAVVAGKALGLWLMVSAMLALLHVVVWGIAVGKGEGTVQQMLSWGGRWLLLSTACAACYAGITTLISSLFRTPPVALFVGVAALMTLGVVGLISSVSGAEIFQYLLPGRYDSLMMSHNATMVLSAVGGLLAWAALTTWTAAEVVRRRDV